MKTRSLTLAALVTALSVVLLYLAGLFPGGSLALAALAAILPAAVILRGGLKWGGLVWAAVSLLSLLLLTNKAVAVLYALVLGHYSIWKSLIERIGKLPVELVCKLAVFNGLLAVFYLVFRDFFAQVTEAFPLPVGVLWVGLSVVFVLYDIGCSRLIGAWQRRFGKYTA